LPLGTVTFLFTDIENSTRFLQSAPAAYPGLLGRHREPVRGLDSNLAMTRSGRS